MYAWEREDDISVSVSEVATAKSVRYDHFLPVKAASLFPRVSDSAGLKECS